MFTTIIGFEDGYRGLPLEIGLAAEGIYPDRTLGVRVGDLPEPQEYYVDQGAAEVLLRRKMTTGEIGCSLAHRAAYAEFIQSGQSTGLIFEDDARLRSRLPVQEIQKHLLSSEPRILLLDWNPGWTVVTAGAAKTENSIYTAPFPPIDARGYALNRAAALLLLDGGSRIQYVADWPVRATSGIQFSIMYPRPVESGKDVASTLEADRQQQGEAQSESPLRKALRLIETASHLKWFNNRRVYGAYRTYLRHELMRLPFYAISRVLNRRLVEDDPSSPILAPTVASTWRNSAKASNRIG